MVEGSFKEIYRILNDFYEHIQIIGRETGGRVALVEKKLTKTSPVLSNRINMVMCL